MTLEKKYKTIYTKFCGFYLKYKYRYKVSRKTVASHPPNTCNRFMDFGRQGFKCNRLCQKLHSRVCNATNKMWLTTYTVRNTRKTQNHHLAAYNTQSNGTIPVNTRNISSKGTPIWVTRCETSPLTMFVEGECTIASWRHTPLSWCRLKGWILHFLEKYK